jgi:AcrR family transcriptional regulator
MSDVAVSEAAAPGEPAAVDGTDAGPETKGERTRRRLLEIAIERFGERGYRATSVSEIARSAGLTQAAVYAYFDSKETLFDAAVDADAAAAITETSRQSANIDANQLVPMLLIFLLGTIDQHPLAKRVLAGHEPDALRRLINLPALADLTAMIRPARHRSRPLRQRRRGDPAEPAHERRAGRRHHRGPAPDGRVGHLRRRAPPCHRRIPPLTPVDGRGRAAPLDHPVEKNR